MEMLERKGMVPVIREEAERKPILGICLGMQLLFESSSEFSKHTGTRTDSGKCGKDRQPWIKDSPYGME